jgi:hypothetical protein
MGVKESAPIHTETAGRRLKGKRVFPPDDKPVVITPSEKT